MMILPIDIYGQIFKYLPHSNIICFSITSKELCEKLQSIICNRLFKLDTYKTAFKIIHQLSLEERQILKISKTYPLAIGLLSLKGETPHPFDLPPSPSSPLENAIQLYWESKTNPKEAKDLLLKSYKITKHIPSSNNKYLLLDLLIKSISDFSLKQGYRIAKKTGQTLALIANKDSSIAFKALKQTYKNLSGVNNTNLDKETNISLIETLSSLPSNGRFNKVKKKIVQSLSISNSVPLQCALFKYYTDTNQNTATIVNTIEKLFQSQHSGDSHPIAKTKAAIAIAKAFKNSDPEKANIYLDIAKQAGTKIRLLSLKAELLAQIYSLVLDNRKEATYFYQEIMSLIPNIQNNLKILEILTTLLKTERY